MIALLERPARSACCRVITPAWKCAASRRLGGISFPMPPIMASGTDISMITKDLHAYRVRNLHQEKSLRDHGPSGDAGGAWEARGVGGDWTPGGGGGGGNWARGGSGRE